METTPAVGVGRRRIIKRPRLTRILDESGARIILLVAPAGYGKTTLAREWLGERRAAWYHGGPASADVAALAVGLATAAAEVVPEPATECGKGSEPQTAPRKTRASWPRCWLKTWRTGRKTRGLQSTTITLPRDLQRARCSSRRFPPAPRLRLLVSTRHRPAWATARRRIYGDLQELDSAALAMNDDEAREVLKPSGIDAAGLLEQAAGWPAVIGLAALTGVLALPAGELPTALYDYFAEELYQAAEPGVRLSLCQLAIPPSIDIELAQFLFGTETAGLVLDHAVRLGIVAPDKGSLRASPTPSPLSRKKARRTWTGSCLSGR